MDSQHNPLRQNAIDAWLSAQIRLCLGQAGMTTRQIGPLLQLHIDPPLFWEIDTFYFGNMTPAAAMASIRSCRPDPKHTLIFFTHAPDEVLTIYQDLGYQYGGIMPMMQKVLSDRESLPSTARIQRVTTLQEVQRLNASGSKMPATHLHDPQLRYYFVEAGELPVCWGRVFYADNKLIYVSAIGTAPAYRRCGLATALMQTIHADAAQMGYTASILVASADATELYTKLGYQTITLMLELMPQELAG